MLICRLHFREVSLMEIFMQKLITLSWMLLLHLIKLKFGQLVVFLLLIIVITCIRLQFVFPVENNQRLIIISMHTLILICSVYKWTEVISVIAHVILVGIHSLRLLLLRATESIVWNFLLTVHGIWIRWWLFINFLQLLFFFFFLIHFLNQKHASIFTLR